MAEDAQIQGDGTDFPDTPRGWASRWAMEFGAAKKEVESWHKSADDILKRFLDKRTGRNKDDTRWNYFTANVQTMRAMLYGKTPKVDVARRFADSNDSVARLASELLERLLNTDIERDSDSFAGSLGDALDDRLLCGLGNARVRYVADFEAGEETPAIQDDEGNELAPAVPAVDAKSREDVEVDYVHWRDQLWSPARRFHEVRWWAFRNQMTRKSMLERFGDVAKLVPLNSKRAKANNEVDQHRADPRSTADVWEIWDKESKQVFWYVDGFGEVLDQKADPYELEGFWPFPRPMVANPTTSGLMPRPDFVLAQDIYDEIDLVSTRITIIERAIAVRGVYDKTANEVKRLVNDSGQNEMIPAENWMAFVEKGGLKGRIDWLPLDMLMGALSALRDYRVELTNAMYQITGMSDIMRGQASDTASTATEQGIKAKFASIRMQALQDDFARFASDLQKLKAEIIAKRFEPETILERSNFQYTFDAQNQQLAMQAVQLIKDKFGHYRIEVKPEAVSMTDFAQLKAERTEWLSTLGAFVQSAAPMIQMMPGAMPFLLEAAKWSLSAVRGGSGIEGVFDQAIAQAEQAAQQAAANPQPQQQDPKLQTVQAKAQGDIAKVQAQMQSDIMRQHDETQQLQQRQMNEAQIAVSEEAAKQRIRHASQAITATLPQMGQGGPV